MLFGLTVGLFGRDTAAAPVHFGLGMVALMATAGVVRRFAGRSAGWVAVLLLLSAYSVWALFGWAYVDLGTMMCGALALVAATVWREKITLGKNAHGWLILMGVIVGLAMGVKYTALALGLALGLFVFIHQPHRVVQNGIIMGLAALLAFAPWAAKGVLLYHNPIYPFALNGLNWNAERAAAFNSDDYSLIARGDAWQLPIIPIAATVFGQDLIDGYGFTTGPWLLTTFLLLPLVWAFLDERERRLALDALTLMTVLVVFWAVNAATGSVGVQTRLMVMMLPAFAAAGAVALHGLANFPKKPFDINFIVRALLALTLALIALDTVRETVRQQVVPYVVAQLGLQDYMYTNTQAYYNAMINLPPDSRVLLMWEPRGYYCPPTTTCTADVLFDNWKLPMLNNGLTPDEVFERYRAEGQDYLLVFGSLYDQYLEFSTYPDLDRAFPEMLDRWMTPVWTDDVRYTLYSWKEPL
jgi:4-amino-4-deoxy-L-arabinose transferase-like glycosyltransferase